MEKLELKKNNFGLKVTCSKCNKTYNHESLKKCNHRESQKYKVVLYQGNKPTTTTNLETRNFAEACKQAIELKQNLKNGMLMKARSYKPSILELADEYLDFMKGENVPLMYKKELTSNYVDSIRQNLEYFMTFMNANGLNVKINELKSITEPKASLYYETILENFEIGSLKTKITIIKNWIDWCIKKRKINIDNVFSNVVIPKSTKAIDAITVNEFNAIIAEIKKGSLIVENRHAGKIKRRQAFRDYLETCYMLAILTGLRRGELIELKWSDLISTKDNKQLVFIVRNIKVENQLKKAYKPKIIPVNSELLDFLETLNVHDKKGKDEYIIHPERIYSKTSMKNDISKSFLYYFRAVFPNKESKPFKALRRTYITYAYDVLGKDVSHFTSHSGEKVLNEHYIDSLLLSKALNLRILGDKE